ncbi:phytosulfokines 3-like [Argentina anserina]|uniref:phytosulfokines 3-like n=1 Tax=Argentina anserina TaxID=57926 RepID=UPI0021767957|nr:phytosulfokines 3-like [Potentilla anserina]
MATVTGALFFIALLLCSTIASSARPEPAFSAVSTNSEKTQLAVVETEQADIEQSCDGVGEEECLMRRTLAAHIDYIYTQKTKP